MPGTPSFLQQRLPFSFPTREAQAGIPLANPTFGALVWGEGRAVRLTLCRPDYWEPLGGPELLEEAPDRHASQHPARLPIGRVDLELPDDWSVASGGLHLLTGEAELELAGPRAAAKLRASILRDSPVLCLRVTGLEGASIRVLSRPPDAPELIERFRHSGMPAAQVFDLGPFGGWTQDCPGQPSMCAGWLRHANAGGLLLYLTSADGEDPQEARRHALQTLETANAAGYTPATLRTFSWWRKWWAQAAAAPLPSPDQEVLRYLERYRRAGIDTPEGPDRAEGPEAYSPRNGARPTSGHEREPSLRVDERGTVFVGLNGRESETVSLMPDWLLESAAQKTHLTEREAKAMAIRRKYNL